MYVFIKKDDEKLNPENIIAYTEKEKVAKDFYEVHSELLNMIKLKGDTKTIQLKFMISNHLQINYYKVLDENGNKFKIPMSDYMASLVLNSCVNILKDMDFTSIIYKKYNMKKKYLKIIKSLTSDLRTTNDKNSSMLYYGKISDYSYINSLKLYMDLINEYY